MSQAKGKYRVRLLTKDYDFLAPLASGDIEPEGLTFVHERDNAQALYRALHDDEVDVGEISFARYILGRVRGDRTWVGIPFFPSRIFRHRCFMVRRDSEFRSLSDLQGLTLGCNEWPATGNVWGRAALREAGVNLETLSWWIALNDDGPPPSSRPDLEVDDLPANVQRAKSGKNLRDLLVAGAIDAQMSGVVPPRGFGQPSSPFVRLFADYRRVEREYYARTEIYPAHHIIAVRRRVFERSPVVLRAIFQCLEESKRRWFRNRRSLGDTTPWLLAEMEETESVMGSDWMPNGVESNAKLIGGICDELFAQQLVAEPVDRAEIFREFTASADS